MESKLAVIEAKWFRGQNISMRGVFDFLTDIHFKNAHSYHYEMFNDAHAFKELFSRMSLLNGIHDIYVAAHGDMNGIYGSNQELISKTIVKNIIESSNDARGRLDSIYFGCCLFGNELSMVKLLCAGSTIKWIAGYDKSVGFIDSSSLDLMFWNHYWNNKKENKSNTTLQHIQKTFADLKNDTGGLMERLGFKVYVWDRSLQILA